MIVFDVKCGNNHVFEGWFADSAAFRAQADAGEIACPVCGDTKVAKALMAPNVATTKSSAKGVNNEAPSDASGRDSVTLTRQKDQAGQMMAMMRAVKAHVEQNFDHVGPRFAEEARKIHYGETDPRNIYGQATREQAAELADEGIEFGQLPDLPDLDG